MSVAMKSQMESSLHKSNDRNLLPSVVGDLKEFNLSLQGTLNENEFILRGHMLEDPSKSIDIKLTRRAELP
jgi:hypothetical protein